MLEPSARTSEVLAMRRSLCAFLFFGSLTLAAPEAPPAAKAPDAPGPLHPYNANGKFKGRYHCPVSAQGLEPLALVLTRDADSDAFKNLLKQLDDLADNNPDARLAVFAVLVSDELTPPPDDKSPDKRDEISDKLNKIEDRRNELAGKLEEMAKGLMLKHTVLALDDKADAAKYVPDDAAAAVRLLYKLRVPYQATLAAKLDEAKAQEIAGRMKEEIAEVVKTVRGKMPQK
jgi:hypothetical protein